MYQNLCPGAEPCPTSALDHQEIILPPITNRTAHPTVFGHGGREERKAEKVLAETDCLETGPAVALEGMLVFVNCHPLQASVL